MEGRSSRKGGVVGKSCHAEREVHWGKMERSNDVWSETRNE